MDTCQRRLGRYIEIAQPELTANLATRQLVALSAWERNGYAGVDCDELWDGRRVAVLDG